MKILGIGVDIIENIRIHKSLKNISFIKRVFSSSEIFKKLHKSYYYDKKNKNQLEKLGTRKLIVHCDKKVQT